MSDFEVISSVINMIWQIFTILFVLYKFTSFFNTIYNFGKFLRKIFRGFTYIVDQTKLYIYKRDNYVLTPSSKSFFTIVKEKCYNLFFKENKNKVDESPLLETHESFIDNINENDNDSNSFELNTSFELNNIVFKKSKEMYSQTDINITDEFFKRIDINEFGMGSSLMSIPIDNEIDSIYFSEYN